MSDPIKYDPSVTISENEDTTSPSTKRVLLYGWDADGLQKVRINVDSSGCLATPDPTFVIYRNAAGEVVKVEKILDGVTKTKLINRTDNVVSSVTTIGPWS